MEKKFRKYLVIFSLGWIIASAFITPPVETYEIITTIILLLAIYILEIVDKQ